jgi:hypothetical protein
MSGDALWIGRELRFDVEPGRGDRAVLLTAAHPLH